MTNIIKKIITMILILQIVFAIGNTSQAASWEDIFSWGDNFIKEGKNQVSQGQIHAGEVNREPSYNKYTKRFRNIFNNKRYI